VINKNFNIINLLEIFTRLSIEINNFSISDNEQHDHKIINITWTVSNPSQMWLMHERAKNLWWTVKVIKREIK
jgi:hypothetical protein